MEIKNALITSSSITMADHDCLTFWLTLKLESGGVNFGGYCIGHGGLDADSFDSSPKGLEAMMRIMDVVGVSKWEDLAGKYIRYEDDGWGSTVTVIGNIMKDKWFDIDEFFKPNRGAADEKKTF